MGQMKQTRLGNFWKSVKNGRIEKAKAPVKNASRKLTKVIQVGKQQVATEQVKADTALLEEDQPMKKAQDTPSIHDNGAESMKSSSLSPTMFESENETPQTSQTDSAASGVLGITGGRSARALLHDSEEESIGAHRAVLSVLIMQEDSSAFFGGSNKQVDKSQEAAEKFRRQAANYPVVQSSTVVKTKDGRPLLYFLKEGMLAGLTLAEQCDLPIQSLNAIRGLIDAYPPPQPDEKDSRVTAEQRQR